MKHLYIVAALAGFWFGMSGASIAAENSIKQIQVRRDGDQVLLKVQMSAPLKTLPGNWSVVEPPRVVIDFPDTDNQSGQSAQQVATGDLKSLNLVQTDKLTRLVLNLYRPTKFSTEISGDVLFIKLQAQGVQASQEPAPSVYSPTAQASSAVAAGKPVPAADNAAIRDIVFRRGEEGQATITVDLTDGSVPIDIRRTGAGINVELRDVELPARLQSRRDVNDFATPVTTITSRSLGNLTRLDIAARGRWFHQAQVTNNQLTIEVKPIPADEANKLVQTGQQGQKISINFFTADATMVLKTLAEISGKDVMIDPSLTGKTITVALNDIPYDQALDIVMAQVDASMRVRNSVVLFGTRAALQKRDQDAADEATRASDVAPLVAETFKLNYVKAADIVSLVNSSFAPATAPTGAAAAPPAAGGAAAPAAAAPAAAAAGTPSNKGMLTSRGGMSIHDGTNQVFVRDTAAVVEAIREVIRSVDVPPKQVMIEARIVEAGTSFNSTLGMRLRLFDSSVLGAGGYRVPGTNTTRAVFGTTAGFTNIDSFGTPSIPQLERANTSVFAPSYSISANTGLMLFNAAGTKLLSLELQASEGDATSKNISSPRVVTLNRKPATISAVTSVTYVSGKDNQGNNITASATAPIKLTVTPSVNPDNRISLDMTIEKGILQILGTAPNQQVQTNNNTVSTSVIVENGGTVVVGGLAEEGVTGGQERVPFLGDLPYVGFLFKTTTKSQSRKELLFFITPRIVSEALTQR